MTDDISMLTNTCYTAIRCRSDLSLLSTVNLQQNFLTGPLPSSWGRLGNLAEMHLNNNMINGSLPDAWSKMDSLYFLALDNNQVHAGSSS
jgi:hypothetical protein